MSPTISIIDVTNRDGVQTAKLGLAKIEKTMINLYLNELGVCQSEFGFPTTSHEVNYLNANVELAELGRGEPEIVETGRQICIGEYSGIRGFRNVSEKLEVVFRDDKEARKILDLVRYANVLKQKPLVADEVRFIARYPEQARKLMTLTP